MGFSWACACTPKYGPIDNARKLTHCHLRAAPQTNDKAFVWFLCSNVLRDTRKNLTSFLSLYCMFLYEEITVCIKSTPLQTFFIFYLILFFFKNVGEGPAHKL